MLGFSVLTIFVLGLYSTLSQQTIQDNHISTTLTSAISKKLDFDGIGGQPNDQCGFKKFGLCLFCIDGYQLSIHFQCVSQFRCVSYNKNNECIKCAEILAFQEGDCIDKNCLQGPSRYKCSSCKNGYIKNDIGVCIAEGCSQFSNGICSKCQQNRQLSNGLCFFVTIIVVNNSTSNSTDTNTLNNVTQTTTTTTTTISTNSENRRNTSGNSSSFDGNGGSTPITIIRIDRDGCLILDAEGNCARCEEAYTLAGSSCIRKDSPCKQYSKSNGNCLECKQKYTLINQLCILNGPPQHCSQYVNGSCLNCDNGYYFVKGYCLKVDPLCKQYQNVYGTCVSCFEGYVLVENRCSIKLSVPNNSSTSIFDQTTTNTSSTLNISILTNISIYYCLQRTQLGQCIKCYERFYLRQNLCVRVNHLCKNYTSDGKCSECFQGYKLSDSLCVIDLEHSPKSNCLRYSPAAAMCLQCQQKYFRHSRGICIQVLPQCKTFQITTGRCNSCYMGFFLANGFCEIIPTSLIVPFCRNYNPMDPRVCRQCVSGYYLESNRCLPVSLSCVAYDQYSGSCISCLNSFILSEGNCLQQEAAQVLAPYCQEYNKSGMCLTCKESYQIINFVCIRK